MTTPKDLLAFKVWGNSTLRDILNSHLLEGQFVDNYLEMDAVEVENFFHILAERIIDKAQDQLNYVKPFDTGTYTGTEEKK